MATTEYSVPNIKCDGCAEAVTSALTAIGGVQNVRVDVPEKRVTVSYDEATVSDNALRTALQEARYPAA